MNDGLRCQRQSTRIYENMSMDIEPIILRGGPAPDKQMDWTGGDEVIVAHHTSMDGADRFQYLQYVRSDDDPRRFDFVKIIC